MVTHRETGHPGAISNIRIGEATLMSDTSNP